MVKRGQNRSFTGVTSHDFYHYMQSVGIFIDAPALLHLLIYANAALQNDCDSEDIIRYGALSITLWQGREEESLFNQ